MVSPTVYGRGLFNVITLDKKMSSWFGFNLVHILFSIKKK